MKDDRLYLLHISESLERIEEYVAEGREAFFANRKTQDEGVYFEGARRGRSSA